MSYNQERLFFWQLIGVGVFNIADYIITLDFLKKGFHECNPLMAAIIGSYGFPLVKLILIPLVLLALWQKKELIGKSIARLFWLPFLIYFYLMGYYGVLMISFS